MIDEETRELERASAASPSDKLLRQRLERAWVRNGHGWAGETLPCGLGTETWSDGEWRENESGIYSWFVPQAGVLPILQIEMIFVSAGEVECPKCQGHGFDIASHLHDHCTACGRSGRIKIDSFYLGRYPVTWREWETYRKKDYPPTLQLGPVMPDAMSYSLYPVVDLTPHMLPFCAWSGLRLPTTNEWKWAALGPPVWCNTCPETEYGDAHRNCPTCQGDYRELRHYPWGIDAPTPERCAALDPRYAKKSSAPVSIRNWHDAHEGAGPCPQCAKGAFVPARPTGASWCGAQDMTGNVWQITADGEAWGGSFRTTDLADVGEPVDLGAGRPLSADDIGFRVALSGVT